ncbi:DnaD domain protein [Aerococcus sp.]|uniref:DnaD domain-containing protein n=1 Tax=Aerococcus sp. TaxID=1872398 RepID=UPI0025BEF8A5|nr:DnaD domain protein [Aerococcus sp.]MBR2130105.1 DnaD domain protein [Aerococcus sp.]
MANRRMFAKTIIDSDAFLDMPLSTQALYFHLSMRADDDGFINNPKKISRMIGCAEDDLKLLIAKKFLLHFESGVVVIKHWLIHNQLRKDRYTPTNYQDEFKQLEKKENGSYRKSEENSVPTRIDVTPKSNANQLATTWQPIGNQMETQVSIGKDSLVKESKDKDSQEENVVLGAIDFYQQNFGILNPYTSQQIVDAIEIFNDEIVIKAMQIALENNVRNYNYVRAILKKWYEHNATTIEDIESLEVEYKNKQTKKSYGKSQKESVAPKWLNQQTRQEKYQGKETTTKPKQMSDDELAELEALKNSVLGGN